MAELAQPTQLPMQLANIPAEQPVRAAASDVNQFQEINPMQSAKAAYSLADTALDYDKKAQAKADNDLVQEALKNGASLKTPDAIDDLAKSLKGKVSPTTYSNLLNLKGEVQSGLDKAFEAMQKKPAKEIEALHAKSEYAAEEFSTVLSAYETIKKTEGLPVAVDKFKGLLNDKLQLLVSYGLIEEKKAKEYTDMTPAQVQAEIEGSKYLRDRTKEAANIAKENAQADM
jgi:hypothetical protein